MSNSISRRDLIAASSALAIMPAMASAQALSTSVLNPPLKVSIDVGAADSKPLKHYWSKCVGAGRANEGLRAGWLEQLKLVKEACGFEYCRFHGLFHDDMFVMKLVNGKPEYNWQYVDDLFDRMLDIGVKPFVELGFVPKDLASNDGTAFWWKGNTSPPNDYKLWADLVTQFVRHIIDRYGIAEVRKWYFEVWNEPNLNIFWHGTRTQYFELYKVSVQAIKAIDSQLRVGGPATSNFVGDDRFESDVEDKSKHLTNVTEDLSTLKWKGVWIEAFLKFCAENKLPVDFVSTHPYPTDFALNPDTGRNKGRTRNVDSTKEDLTWLRKTVSESAYPNAEIHLTEWSSSPSARDSTHDYLPAAAYIIKANLDSIGLVDSLSYWTFTDIFEENGGGSSPFHGGFGMVNFQGVPKPSFHAYRMLHALGDEIIHKEDGLIVTRHSKSGKHTILAYHFPKEVKTALSFGGVEQAENLTKQGTPRNIGLTLKGTKAARYKLERLDLDHGNVVREWQRLGRPNSPTRAQLTTLKAASAVALEAHAVKGKTLTWNAVMTPWSCVLLSEQ